MRKKLNIKAIGTTVAVLLISGLGMNACQQSNPNFDTNVNEQNDAAAGPTKDPNLPPGTVLLDVTWPSADTIDKTARNMLSAENLAVVNSAPVPVLVPNDPKMLKNGVMMTNKNNDWYAFSSEYDPADGIGWKIEGTKTLFVAKHGELPDDLPSGYSTRSKNIYITDNEIGWRASWNENGISYGMIYGCDREKEDIRCKDETMIRKIAENAVYVGGKGKE